MNATPLLGTLLDALAAEELETVLIGNAAAAVQVAPATTLDFMFRDTPTTMAKLKRLATRLGAVILRPFYPVSRLYRLTSDATGLQADFRPVIHGGRSFESLWSRAVVIDAGEARVAARKKRPVRPRAVAEPVPPLATPTPVRPSRPRVITSSTTSSAAVAHSRWRHG